MIFLTIDEIIELHSKLIEKTGGCQGIRDKNLIESAIYSSMASFADTEIYPSIEEKAAKIMFSLTNNHAFTDGNKRIGILVMLLTLELNAVKVKYSQSELINLGLSVADGSSDYYQILNWIQEHKIT